MNDMSQTRPAAIIRELAPDSERATDLPRDIIWPDLSHHPHYSGAYAYHAEDGAPVMMLVRYEKPKSGTANQVRTKLAQYTPWRDSEGTLFWARTPMEGPRPMYNLTDVIERPEAMVILCETEKCADSVKAEFPSCASISFGSGANLLNMPACAYLKGREVVFFPSHRTDADNVAETVRATLVNAGAKSVRILDIIKLAQLVSPQDCVPSGYGFEDAVRGGLTGNRFVSLSREHPDLIVPTYTTPSSRSDNQISQPGTEASKAEVAEKDFEIGRHLKETWGHDLVLPDAYTMDKGGLIKHGTGPRGVPTATFAGSPLAVVGLSQTGDDGEGCGFVITFLSRTGVWEEVIVPNHLLAGEGKEMREILARKGFILPQDKAGRQALAEYVSYTQSEKIIELVSGPGWTGKSFALPHAIITPEDCPSTVQLDMQGRKHFFGESGTLEEWKALVGLMEDSSRAAFILSAALAGPLLRPLDVGGGGFHFFGRSSKGKTTLLRLAGSVWGGGGPDGFVRNWKMTDNSVEAVAADHNDVAFPLDEMGMLEPEQAAAIIYMLANGRGKGRASKTGGMLPTAQWRVMVLSNGEVPSSALIASGRRGSQRRMTGGLAVRIVDIPIEPMAGQTFEDLAGFESEGALAEYIGLEASRVYGHAGPEFVRKLVADFDGNLVKVQEVVAAFLEMVSEPGDDPQVKRVAKRFALVAAAGSMAIYLGILPWKPKAALYAAFVCYGAWRDARGTNRSEDEREALRMVTEFFELHGSSRFEPVQAQSQGDEDPLMLGDTDRIIRDRCGYRAADDEGNAIYYVFPEAFRSQVCGGHSPDLVLEVAREREALILGEDDRLQKKVRLPDYPKGTRVYAFQPHKLMEE